MTDGLKRFEYFLAEKLGYASPRLLKAAITRNELLEWMAYHEFEGKYRDVAMRHPKWAPEMCIRFLQSAYRISQQNKELVKRGNRNEGN